MSLITRIGRFNLVYYPTTKQWGVKHHGTDSQLFETSSREFAIAWMKQHA